MQQAIGHGTKLDHIVRKFQLFYQVGSRVSAVGPGIVLRAKLAGQDQAYFLGREPVAHQVKGPDESFEVPVIVVVADKEQAQSSFGGSQSATRRFRKRSLVGEEQLSVEAMMNRGHICATPIPKLVGKSTAGCDSRISAQNRPAHKP